MCEWRVWVLPVPFLDDAYLDDFAPPLGPLVLTEDFVFFVQQKGRLQVRQRFR